MTAMPLRFSAARRREPRMDQPVSPRPLALARWLFAIAAMIVAIVAIGGITPARVRELAAVGCRGVAVSAAICGAADPAAAVRALREGLE